MAARARWRGQAGGGWGSACVAMPPHSARPGCIVGVAHRRALTWRRPLWRASLALRAQHGGAPRPRQPKVAHLEPGPGLGNAGENHEKAC